MRRRIFSVIGLVLSLVLAGSLVAIAPTATAQQADDSTTPGDILDNPDDFYDQDVTIENATVGDSVSGQAFTLSRNGDELLVVGNRDDLPDDISADSTVTVDGTVREFTSDADFVEDLGISPDQRAFRDFEGDPVVYADSVEMTEGESNGNNQDTNQVEETTPLSTIMEDPSDFYGNQVSILAQLEDQISADAGLWTITTGDADSELAVVTQTTSVPSSATLGAIVRITGTLYELTPDEPFQVLDAEGNEVVVDADDPAFDDFNEQPILAATSVELVAPELGAMVENILDDTDAYLGESVTLIGTVDSVGGNQAFAFDGPEGFLGLSEETLLVVGSQDVMAQRVDENAIVQVTGTVRPFDTDNAEGWGGEIFETQEEFEAFIENTDSDFISGYDDEPVVMADSMKVLARERGQTIEDILNNTDDYLGTDVTVAGMVEEDISSQAFTLEGTDGFFGISEDNLLVIGQEQALQSAGVTEDVIVIVSGTVRQYDPEDKFDSNGETFELQDTDALTDWEGDEVLVADSVNVIAID